MTDTWKNGNAYEMYVGRWSRQIGRKFLTWLDPAPDMRWLDLGCGTGALTSEVLKSCSPRTIIGIEPSNSFLTLARKQVSDARAQFLQGAGDDIPVADGTIDVAVSGLVLNFIPDKSGAMEKLSRVVSPGGTIAAYVWDYAGHVQFMRRFWDAAAKVDPRGKEADEGVLFPICRPKALETLFGDAGLRDVAITPIDIPTPFDDFDDFWTPFLAGNAPAPAFCASLSPDQRDKLRALLVDTLPTDPDGRILLAARAWAVRGTR